HSLGDLDQLEDAHGKAYHDALGEEGSKDSIALEKSALLNEEVNLIAIRPRMSNPPEAWRDADPGFWRGKIAAAKKKEKDPAP
ncbi:MAG: hypothetical protein ACRD4K_05740, partial [Candidatus Acidiferrales bacterium]